MFSMEMGGLQGDLVEEFYIMKGIDGVEWERSSSQWLKSEEQKTQNIVIARST